MTKKARYRRSTKRRLARVEGYVWCDKHGSIHEDSLDPYEYGEPEMQCEERDHYAVYARQEPDQ